MNYPPWARRTGATLNRNSPSILTGIAIGGVVATTILAVKVTPEARIALCDKFLEKNNQADPDGGVEKDLTLLEKVQTTWAFYIPTALSGAATIACIIGANQIGLRRNAALAGAYAIANTALNEYKEEVVKVLGKAKASGVDDEVAKRQIEDRPVSDQQVIITGGGDQLCFDRYTGRYFRSDIESIKQKANQFNKDILGGNMYGSLNEWYATLGLADTTVGDEVGFNVDTLVELVFSSHLAQDGAPCLAVGFAYLPRPDYSKL